MLLKCKLSKSSDLAKAQVYVIAICADQAPKATNALSKELLKSIKDIPQELNLKHGTNFTLFAKDKHILLCSVGKSTELTAEKIRQAGGHAFNATKNIKAKTASVIMLFEDDLKDSEHPAIFYFIEGMLLSSYSFDKYKKPTEEQASLEEILIDNPQVNIHLLMTTLKANFIARDLVNTPSNDLTPTALALSAKKFQSQALLVKVLNKQDITRLKMHALLAVSQGSHEAPALIEMHYKASSNKSAPIVLVGKAITFDSGGLSLKPADGLEKMKYDMAGGAAVIAVMQALSELKIKQNVIGLVPASENMPGGSAVKPGDIVRSMNGKTIEIINTDAEGRLILVDAITYAIRKFKPALIIDIATLTGACAITFGYEAIAMMGTCQKTMNTLKKSSEETYERVWQMPLYEEYKEYLKSDTADIKNIGGRFGSMLTAGYFIKEFTENTPWVHLDIAATAYAQKSKHYIQVGATGVAVRLLLHFLRHYNA